ncbi:MAG: hypothetical protein Q8P68_05100 [Candidatus Peregrinibacteria bacterium]|nr:hypothetical protein [Candidatus Peregrinibacteria bacterium]MDZ4244471.1 hypothetical protein [Candidatus Gracilibacteria bacterium]
MTKKKIDKSKGRVIKARLGFSLEVVLTVVVLAVLSQVFPFFNKHEDQPKSEKTDNANISTYMSGGRVSQTGEHFTPIEMVIIGSPTLSEKVVTKYPDLPGGIKVFDKSKFIESEINQFEGGTEYFLTFEYPGMTDSDGFKTFYENFASKNGWQLNLIMSAINGIKVTMQNENIEMRIVTFEKENPETQERFIREKVRVFEAK